jgi:hypothetical protein
MLSLSESLTLLSSYPLALSTISASLYSSASLSSTAHGGGTSCAGSGSYTAGASKLVSLVASMGGVDEIVGGVGRGGVIRIVFGLIYGTVRAPLNIKTSRLDEGLVVGKGKGFNTSNDSVRKGTLGPAMAGKARVGGKGHEINSPWAVPVD